MQILRLRICFEDPETSCTGVNKVDNFDKFMPDVYEFYNLGIGDPLPVSALPDSEFGDMLDEVIAHFPEHEAEEEDERPKSGNRRKTERRKIFIYH